MKPNLSHQLHQAAFVQARLLDTFIQLAREAWDAESGFTRESLADLLDSLREERRVIGQLVRPCLVEMSPGRPMRSSATG